MSFYHHKIKISLWKKKRVSNEWESFPVFSRITTKCTHHLIGILKTYVFFAFWGTCVEIKQLCLEKNPFNYIITISIHLAKIYFFSKNYVINCRGYLKGQRHLSPWRINWRIACRKTYQLLRVQRNGWELSVGCWIG